MRAGLPVYLEKPLARAEDDGASIAAAWESTGAVCAVGYQWRSLDLIDRMRRELAGAAPGLMAGAAAAACAQRSPSPLETPIAPITCPFGWAGRYTYARSACVFFRYFFCSRIFIMVMTVV